ncbi:MAG: hypothetical protein NC124_02545 [Clostridium sp.]|nr:hypothetical protein [Clostridium sp.]
MGYRNYLYIADKKKLNKIRKMAKEELWSLSKEEPYDNEPFPYIKDVLDAADAEVAFEMGKYIDYRNRLKPFLRSLFRDKEAHKYYNEENEMMIAKPEILQTLATIFKEKVQAHYKNLMEEKSLDEFDEHTQFDRLLASARSNLMWSEYLDKLPNNKYALSSGWLYEHEVFSILYLMRIFNPKKQVLIYRGY